MAEQIIIDLITIFSLLPGDQVEYFSIFLVAIIGISIIDAHPVFSQLVFWWTSRQSCNQGLEPELAALSSWMTVKLK